MRFVSCNKSPCFRATISPLNCWNATFDWLLVCQTTKQRSDSSPFLDMSSSSLLRRAPPLLPLQTPLGSSVVSPEAQGAFRGEMAAAEAAQTMATVPSEVAPGVVWGKAREGRGEQSRAEQSRAEERRGEEIWKKTEDGSGGRVWKQSYDFGDFFCSANG